MSGEEQNNLPPQAENLESPQIDSQDIFSQKQKELGWTDEQTEAVRDTFSAIQKDIKEPIDEYIIQNIDQDFIYDFQDDINNKTTKDIHDFYKTKIIIFFESQNIQLTFTTYNSLLSEEEEKKREEEENKREEEENKREEEEKKREEEEKKREEEEKKREEEEKKREEEEKKREEEEKKREEEEKKREEEEKFKKLEIIQQQKRIKAESIKKSEKIIQESEKITQESEKLKEKIKIGNSFKSTKENYDSLSQNFKTKVESYPLTPEQQQKQEIIKQKLAEKGFDETEQENYAKQYLTFFVAQSIFGLELSKESGAKEFISSFQSLKENIGDIDTISDISKNKNLNQTSQNLLSNSPSLKKASEETNPTIDNITIKEQEIFEYMPDSIIENIKESQKNLLTKYPKLDLFQKDSFLIKKNLNTNELTQEQIKDIGEYNQLVQTNIQETQKKVQVAKETIKQQITVTPVIGISRYLDTNIGKQKLDENFLINPGQGISLNNNILDISGTIDGKTIKLRQNLQDGSFENNQLQTNSFLTIDQRDKISLGQDVMQNIGVILPTKQLLNQRAETRINKNLKNEIKNSKNIQESISNNLGNNLLENYGQESIVRNRLSTNIQKNLTKQKTIEFMEKTLGKINESDLSTDSLGGKTSENLRIMKGIIYGIDNLSKDECIRLNTNLEQFEAITKNLEKNKELSDDPILENFGQEKLKEDKKTRENNKSKNNAIFTLFDYLIKDSGIKQEIQVQDFEKVINKRQKNEKITGTEQFLSANFRNKFEEKNKAKLADDFIDKKWPTLPVIQ